MRCLQISETGIPSFLEQACPETGSKEVLIKTRYIGLCGSDLSAFRMQSPMAKYPLIPGHEICGTIATLGKEVPNSFRVGDLVTVYPYFTCGKCSACLQNRPNACRDNHTLGVQIPGALCEYISVPYEHVIVCTDFAHQELAALIEPLSVGFHLNCRCGTTVNDTVAVFGCGAIGLGAVAAAAYAGATVIAVDIDDKKLEIAKELGAAYVVNSMNTAPADKIRKLTGGQGCSIAIEAAGTPITFLNAIDAVCFAGKIGIVSYMKKDVTLNTKLLVSKELNVYGSRNALDEFGQVMEMIKKNPQRFQKMITKIYPFDQAIQALEDWNQAPPLFTKILISMPE